MTADPIPHDYGDLVAELAKTASAAQIDQWLFGTAARRNALPATARARLAGVVAAHRVAFAAHCRRPDMTPAPHPADTLPRPAMLRLDPLHLGAIRLGAGAATLLGMPTARDAAATHHELWTAALLVHEVATNPLWQVGWPRPARTVATALVAARRLTDAALAALAFEAQMPMER